MDSGKGENDGRIETTRCSNKGFLHRRSDQFYRPGHYGPHWKDEHLGHSYLEIQAVPVVYAAPHDCKIAHRSPSILPESVSALDSSLFSL